MVLTSAELWGGKRQENIFKALIQNPVKRMENLCGSGEMLDCFQSVESTGGRLSPACVRYRSQGGGVGKNVSAPGSGESLGKVWILVLKKQKVDIKMIKPGIWRGGGG